MSAYLSTPFRLFNKEHKRDQATYHNSKHPKIIDVGQHGRFANKIGLHHGIGLLLRKDWPGAGKSAGEQVERRLKLSVCGVKVLDEANLVKLGAASESRGDERDSHAATDISGEVHQSRCGIIFVTRKRRIGGSIDRHKQESEA